MSEGNERKFGVMQMSGVSWASRPSMRLGGSGEWAER